MVVVLKQIALKFLFEGELLSIHINFLARVSWKLPYFNKYLLLQTLKVSKSQNKNKQHVFLFDKALTVPRLLVGSSVNIYKGNLFRKLTITKYLTGFKFGEFTHTRKPFTYPLKKKKNKLRR